MAAFTNCLNFLKVVGDLKKASGTLKTTIFAPKIEAEAVAHDGNILADGDLHKLVDLSGSEELCFINEDAGDIWVILDEFVVQIRTAVETEISFSFGSDASV